nr:EOG090X0CZM [Polyphemus pediculus]
MALFRWHRIASTIVKLPSISHNGAPILPIVRQQQYSLYPPYVKEPTVNPEKLDAWFESGEAAEKAFVPIKAARSDQTSSIFYDEIANKFMNTILRKGNRLVARNLLENAFIKVKQIQITKLRKAETEAEKNEIELNPINILHKAIENSKPLLLLTPIKRGGTVYQVPIPVSEKHASFLAMRWLIEASKDKERTIHFPEKLANELIDASNNTGRVVKRKQDLHRQCEANRAYSHYRWG